ncbi:MAG: hypothetical protein QOK04_1934 [Solirubrobacteraceae bacterium]|jgi:hypothetical protein|nr:hypothetical protein [Solirubrobacteraceae bacterium]
MWGANPIGNVAAQADDHPKGTLTKGPGMLLTIVGIVVIAALIAFLVQSRRSASDS